MSKSRPVRNNKNRSGKNSPQRARSATAAAQSASPPREETADPRLMSDGGGVWTAAVALVVAVFIWSYWPVWQSLVSQWNRIPDYSHGFLVLPLAGLFLWLTRDRFPGLQRRISWGGAVLILVAGGLRVLAALWYLEPLQGATIPLWVGGFVWMFFGWPVFRWALPSIAFLVFMLPLPYTLETMLAVPLQNTSTRISVFLLQCLGQPAIAEGTTIQLGTHTLEVERACSGLRIFFGITALAFAFIILFRRPFWIGVALLASILPIALLANSLRIVVTGLLYQTGMESLAKGLGHDLAGWFMIPLAALMFAGVLKYLDRLFPVIVTMDGESLVRTQSRLQPAGGGNSSTPGKS